MIVSYHNNTLFFPLSIMGCLTQSQQHHIGVNVGGGGKSDIHDITLSC